MLQKSRDNLVSLTDFKTMLQRKQNLKKAVN